MSRISQVLTACILPLLISQSCGHPGLQLDVSLPEPKKLELSFPDVIKGAYKNVYVNKTETSSGLQYSYYGHIAYGMRLDLEFWHSDSETISKENFEKFKKSLVNSVQNMKIINPPNKNLRLQYVNSQKFAGFVWTNKKYLFKAEGKNTGVVKDFLIQLQLAKNHTTK